MNIETLCILCSKNVKNAKVSCKRCGRLYCKKLCLNKDYISHETHCDRGITIIKTMQTFPLLKLIIERLRIMGYFGLFCEELIERNDLLLEIDLDYYLNGEDLTSDEISYVGAEYFKNIQTNGNKLIYLKLYFENIKIGEYILAFKK